jgi:D-glycero-alpha-D-manno-heptose-7-phosphate kinase
MQVIKEGSVRVDLLGGTVDLEPINLILDGITLNVATGLKAKVKIERNNENKIHIFSHDYKKEYEVSLVDLTEENLYKKNKFKEMTFVLQIVSLFSRKEGLDIHLSSGAPAGSGLGGSSAMGVVLHSALAQLYNKNFSILETVLRVKGVEGRILNQGVPGYQDYFPALTGGVLALYGEPGEIKFEQLYDDNLKEFLEGHITLVFSGINRDSGINNWDVYKKFFDGNEKTQTCLSEISDLSRKAYQAIKEKHYESLLELIHLEGQARKDLSESIAPAAVLDLYYELTSTFKGVGFKMCGAGGGGCFILTHSPSDRDHIHQIIQKHKMKVLEFVIEKPLEQH